MSTDDHVREAVDRVLEEVRASLDSTLRQLAATVAADVRASDVRFADALRRMDEAPSLRAVLHALMHAVEHEADRSALLILSQGRFKGWSSSGFAGSAADPKAIVLPSDPGGVLGAAIRAKSTISIPASGGASAAERPQFALGPGARDAIAVPLVLGGTVAALLYADSPAAGHPASSWMEAVNRLARYAALLLETRTARYLMSAEAAPPLASVSDGARGRSGGPR